MNVTEIANESLKRSYKIVVPADSLAASVDTRLAEMAKTASQPGFRPGKVPKTILRRQFGQALYGEAVEKSVNESVGKTIEEKGLRPALQPRVEVKNIKEGEDLEFEVTVELMPEIADIAYGNIRIERPKAIVEDKTVEEAIGRIADANRERKSVEPARPAAKGDLVKIDFVGCIDGKAFENGSAEGFELELGSNSLIPGFEDQLIGIGAGDEREVKVSFPAEYGAAELAGKDATFTVKAHEIKEFVPRPVDDELAKSVGFDTLDLMRAGVRERIERDYTQLTRSIVKRRLLDHLAENHKFDVPQGLVEGEFESIWQQFERSKEAGQKPEGEAGQPEADKPEADKPEEEKLKVEYRDIANRRVRLGLMLAEIGRKNNIEVTAAEINAAVVREAQRYPRQEKMVFEFYGKNVEMRERLRAPIFEDKTVDFILELATVTDKPVSPDDLVKAAREDEEAAQSRAAV